MSREPRSSQSSPSYSRTTRPRSDTISRIETRFLPPIHIFRKTVNLSIHTKAPRMPCLGRPKLSVVVESTAIHLVNPMGSQKHRPSLDEPTTVVIFKIAAIMCFRVRLVPPEGQVLERGHCRMRFQDQVLRLDGPTATTITAEIKETAAVIFEIVEATHCHVLQLPQVA